MEDSSYVTYCRLCNAKIAADSSFCTECGHSLKDNSGSDLACASCGENLDPEYLFCPECGDEIKSIGSCPQCTARIQPGTTFCNRCGINIQEYQKPSPSDSKIKEIKDDLKDTDKKLEQDNEKTDRGLMKGLGGFLGRKGSSEKKITPTMKEQRYLVCNSCRGYYQLQKGEEPEDFSDECECGGRLECKDSKE
jgi:Double zinc ribbon